jgi:hypothetical protein
MENVLAQKICPPSPNFSPLVSCNDFSYVLLPFTGAYLLLQRRFPVLKMTACPFLYAQDGRHG